MIFSKINIDVLTDLIAESGHGSEVYYLSQAPDVLAESLLKAARMDEADLILVPDEENPVALASIRPLDWDTRFFGYPCALIDTIAARGDIRTRVEAARQTVDRALNLCRSKGVRFVSTKLPGPDPAVVQALENHEFSMTNVNFRLTWTTQMVQPLPLGSGFRFTTENDDPESTARTFRRLFYDGRFHNDPRVSPETADRLWEAAILNQLKTEAEDVLFLQKGRRIVGLATIKSTGKDRSTGTLFVFGLIPEFRGIGLGRALLSELLVRVKDKYERIELETSSFNLPAVGMYRRHGFHVMGARVALHWWNNEV